MAFGSTIPASIFLPHNPADFLLWWKIPSCISTSIWCASLGITVGTLCAKKERYLPLTAPEWALFMCAGSALSRCRAGGNIFNLIPTNSDSSLKSFLFPAERREKLRLLTSIMIAKGDLNLIQTCRRVGVKLGLGNMAWILYDGISLDLYCNSIIVLLWSGSFGSAQSFQSNPNP